MQEVHVYPVPRGYSTDDDAWTRFRYLSSVAAFQYFLTRAPPRTRLGRYAPQSDAQLAAW
jgi:hypothetical protein